MARQTQTINLDMKPQKNPPHIAVTEYDKGANGWLLRLRLFQDGEPFIPNSGTTVKIEGTTPGGTGFSASAQLVSNDNMVTFTLTEDMTAYNGSAWCKLILTKDGSVSSASGFWLDCDRAGVEAGTIIGGSGFEEQLQTAFTEYLEEHGTAPVGSGVASVNGKSGVVALKASDLENDSGYITEDDLKSINLGSAYLETIALSDLGADLADGYTMQGGTVNSDTGEILIAFHKANTAVSILKLLNADWSLKATYSAEIGHANDLTYNPLTKHYYVADGDSSNIVYALDSDTLEVVETININVGSVIASITYSADEDCYYFQTYPDKQIYRCNSDFEGVSLVCAIPSISEYAPSPNSPYVQGSAMIGGYYVPVHWHIAGDNGMGSFARLWFVDGNAKEVAFRFDVKSQGRYDESEFLIEQGGAYILVGYSGGYLTRCRIYTDGETFEKVSVNDGAYFTSVNDIPANSMGFAHLARSTFQYATLDYADVVYHCYGNGSNRTLRVEYSGKNYYRVKQSGTWSTWLEETGIQSSVPSSTSNRATIAHGSDIVLALVAVRSTQGLTDALFFMSCYGVGGTARDHIHQITEANGVVYTTSVDGNSIVIDTSLNFDLVSIFPLYGDANSLTIAFSNQ